MIVETEPSLRSYQTEAMLHLATRSRALLADRPRLGKTPPAIRAAAEVGANSLLIICPAHAKINWSREVAKWGGAWFDEPEVLYGTGARVDPLARSGVVIVNYELLQHDAVFNSLRKQPWDVVIADESHYLCNRRTIMTKAVYGPRCDGEGGLTEGAGKVWCLTGTPQPNNPSELWPMLRALAPERLGDKFQLYANFLHHFCDVRETKWGLSIDGARNEAELAEMLKGFMLRRTTVKGLSRREYGTLTLDGAGAAFAALKALEHDAQVKRFSRAIDRAATDDEVLEIMADIDEAVRLRLRRLSALAKVEGLAETLTYELQTGLEKVVVFAWHVDAIEALAQQLEPFGAVTLTGASDPRQKQSAVDRFQNETNTRVLIGNIRSAGTNLTLDAATDIVFLERDWVPVNNEQAEARCDNVGDPDRSVLVRDCFLANSPDERIGRVLARKSRMIRDVIGD